MDSNLKTMASKHHVKHSNTKKTNEKHSNTKKTNEKHSNTKKPNEKHSNTTQSNIYIPSHLPPRTQLALYGKLSPKTQCLIDEYTLHDLNDLQLNVDNENSCVEKPIQQIELTQIEKTHDTQITELNTQSTPEITIQMQTPLQITITMRNEIIKNATNIILQIIFKYSSVVFGEYNIHKIYQSHLQNEFTTQLKEYCKLNNLPDEKYIELYNDIYFMPELSYRHVEPSYIDCMFLQEYSKSILDEINFHYKLISTKNTSTMYYNKMQIYIYPYEELYKYKIFDFTDLKLKPIILNVVFPENTVIYPLNMYSKHILPTLLTLPLNYCKFEEEYILYNGSEHYMAHQSSTAINEIIELIKQKVKCVLHIFEMQTVINYMKKGYYLVFNTGYNNIKTLYYLHYNNKTAMCHYCGSQIEDEISCNVKCCGIDFHISCLLQLLSHQNEFADISHFAQQQPQIEFVDKNVYKYNCLGCKKITYTNIENCKILFQFMQQ